MKNIDLTTCYIILGVIGFVLLVLLITFFTLLKKTRDDAKKAKENTVSEIPANTDENLNPIIDNKFETITNQTEEKVIKNDEQNKIS